MNNPAAPKKEPTNNTPALKTLLVVTTPMAPTRTIMLNIKKARSTTIVDSIVPINGQPISLVGLLKKVSHVFRLESIREDHVFEDYNLEWIMWETDEPPKIRLPLKLDINYEKKFKNIEEIRKWFND